MSRFDFGTYPEGRSEGTREPPMVPSGRQQVSVQRNVERAGVSYEQAVVPHPYKTCPRCGAKLFDDMNVCYGCLYDFEKTDSTRAGWGGTHMGELPVFDQENDETWGSLDEVLELNPAREVAARINTTAKLEPNQQLSSARLVSMNRGENLEIIGPSFRLCVNAR